MTARAVRCFLSQTYERKALLIFDSGKKCLDLSGVGSSSTFVRAEKFIGSSIGALRNAANELCRGTDIIAHWDSDDWSHPYRLAEQVNLLQASLAEAVGYNDMLMWESNHRDYIPNPANPKESISVQFEPWTWLYDYDGHGVPQQAHGRRPKSAYALETSLLYWRRSWEKLKFEDNNLGDCRWMKTVRCVSDSSFPNPIAANIPAGPRMIAEIHSGNTVMRPDLLRGHEFKRVPEWDAFCLERMKL